MRRVLHDLPGVKHYHGETEDPCLSPSHVKQSGVSCVFQWSNRADHCLLYAPHRPLHQSRQPSHLKEISSTSQGLYDKSFLTKSATGLFLMNGSPPFTRRRESQRQQSKYYERGVAHSGVAPVALHFPQSSHCSGNGQSGPYAFGVGLTTYLVSKEIYVLEHEYYTGISVAILCVLIVKKLGPPVAKYLDKEIDVSTGVARIVSKWKRKHGKDIEAGWNQGREASIKDLEDSVESEKKEQWRAEGQSLLFEAKKENVALQLEATYRERVAEVYNEVKRRLDYQVERLNVDRRIAHKHMVSWILSNVLKSITPQQEKESLQKCIADLKSLAAKA
uniref:ATP synthase subunit b n=1 Tax=Timema shepardi TaxID=629360 RepID=A0A7R9FWE0_TIMSH|nr:unnamed protein product [Timema shepardi]